MTCVVRVASLTVVQQTGIVARLVGDQLGDVLRVVAHAVREDPSRLVRSKTAPTASIVPM